MNIRLLWPTEESQERTILFCRLPENNVILRASSIIVVFKTKINCFLLQQTYREQNNLNTHVMDIYYTCIPVNTAIILAHRTGRSSRVEVTLRLTVSQSVCLGIDNPCGTCYHILLPVGMFVWKLRSYFCVAPSLTTGRICNLQCNH
jgi:hypothetical protein